MDLTKTDTGDFHVTTTIGTRTISRKQFPRLHRHLRRRYAAGQTEWSPLVIAGGVTRSGGNAPYDKLAAFIDAPPGRSQSRNIGRTHMSTFFNYYDEGVYHR